MDVKKNRSISVFVSTKWDKFRFKLKRHFIEVLKTKKTDKAVAQGYALGTFVSILPTPGLSALIAIAMLAIFKRINKVSVFIAMAIWNIWTVMPFYWLSIVIGDAIFDDKIVVLFEIDWINHAFRYTRRFVVGNLIILIPFSIANYYFALWLLKKVRGGRVQRANTRKRK